jgi:pimeloyl-ACP methyl ester carboxylesterase
MMATVADATWAEQSRAVYPDAEGYVERDGVRVFYEVYGRGEPTVLFLPTWSIMHSRGWKMQIPYFARHCRVVTFDGAGEREIRSPVRPRGLRGNRVRRRCGGGDGRHGDRSSSARLAFRGAERSLHIGAGHPDRIAGMVFIAPALPLPPATPRASAEQAFVTPLESYDGWEKWNKHYWLDRYEDFVEFFFSQVFTEPHSTKQREDAVGWALDTDAETLVATQLAQRLQDEAGVRALAAHIHWPVLVIHGRDDAVRPHDSGAAFAELAAGTFVSWRARATAHRRVTR